MEIIRYDGTRLMTVHDVDREFLGHSVLLDNREFSPNSRGYLLASAYSEDEDEAFEAMRKLNCLELGGLGLVLYGSAIRGMTIGIFDYA
ncbi:MAG: hypothetical protein LBE35_01630 [Clostridiales bacterium]|jgi:hypothetical protein|nr:hypothetical protein [Clostridiales bacterium]